LKKSDRNSNGRWRRKECPKRKRPIKNSCVLRLNLASDTPTDEAARPSAQEGAAADETFPRGIGQSLSDTGFKLLKNCSMHVESENRSESKSCPAAREAALIQQVCQGDRDAFYALVQPYERATYVAALSILKNPADAEEAVQEAVLKALANIHRFRSESKFSTWLIQITINEARLKIRKGRKHLYESMDESRTDESGDYFPRDFADWREIPSEALERKELRNALQRAMASLPQKYREVLFLRDIQHLSIEETAQVLGLGAGNVKTRLLRARLQMRDALAPGFDGSWSTGKAQYQKVRAW
jgi:RNA polymerase sigma-70 factor (ECF subfamily)